MKTSITLLMLISFAVKAAPQKNLVIKAHVVKAMREKDIYRLELAEYAAAYYTNEIYFPCIQKSLKENKELTLEVTAKYLTVQKCTVNN